jgi:hypothetical protein
MRAGPHDRGHGRSHNAPRAASRWQTPHMPAEQSCPNQSCQSLTLTWWSLVSSMLSRFAAIRQAFYDWLALPSSVWTPVFERCTCCG